MTTRAVIYARYSSDNQRETPSLEDQVRLCRERVTAEGWEVVQVFRDAAISGATTLRPGYQGLLEGAREARFDVVIAEALDRLSRDQEDVAALFKRLQYAGIRLITVGESEITGLHVGLKGAMNALFLKDLADRTRRGLHGRIASGKSAGGRCYGYRVVRQFDAAGQPIRGDRAIDDTEAIIVRRIFAMFAAGTSPIAIARALNAEKVPGPEGKAWRDTTIRGHAARGTGILRNELYAGQLVWNRMRFLKDPATGKRVSRINPQEQRVTEPVPHLRIIDDALWNQVQDRLRQVREASGADDPNRPRFWERRRARHLLSGKVVCGACGGTFASVGRDYLACAAARRQDVCTNRRGIRRYMLEALILDALRERLMAPELVTVFVTEFTAEWNRLQAALSADAHGHRQELVVIQRKLDGLVEAIADGLRAPDLQRKLDELVNRRTVLERTLGSAPSPAPRMHPAFAETYRQRVMGLQTALRGPGGAEALEAARDLIERVAPYPSADGSGLEIELVGAIAAMVELAMGGAPRGACRRSDGDRALFARSVKVVAGACNH